HSPARARRERIARATPQPQARLQQIEVKGRAHVGRPRRSDAANPYTAEQQQQQRQKQPIRDPAQAGRGGPLPAGRGGCPPAARLGYRIPARNQEDRDLQSTGEEPVIHPSGADGPARRARAHAADRSDLTHPTRTKGGHRMAVSTRSGGYIERPKPSGLADVLEIILDKGLVIDLYLRVSLVGIELLTVDARIVVA